MMRWLLALETENDLIATCRLMNTFRRKGPKITTLAMALRPAGYSMMVVAEGTEAEMEHIFNFLRRIEGVEHVTCYRHEPSADASFVFVDTDADSTSVARILETFPESKLVFASHGKYLLEVPAACQRASVAFDLKAPEFLQFARVKTTRVTTRPELVRALAS